MKFIYLFFFLCLGRFFYDAIFTFRIYSIYYELNNIIIYFDKKGVSVFERRLWPTTVLYVPRHSSFEIHPRFLFLSFPRFFRLC